MAAVAIVVLVVVVAMVVVVAAFLVVVAAEEVIVVMDSVISVGQRLWASVVGKSHKIFAPVATSCCVMLANWFWYTFRELVSLARS